MTLEVNKKQRKDNPTEPPKPKFGLSNAENNDTPPPPLIKPPTSVEATADNGREFTKNGSKEQDFGAQERPGSKFHEPKQERMRNHIRETRNKVRELVDIFRTGGASPELLQEAHEFASEVNELADYLQANLLTSQDEDTAAESAAAEIVLAMTSLVGHGQSIQSDLEESSRSKDDKGVLPKWLQDSLAKVRNILGLFQAILRNLPILIARMRTPKEWTLKVEFDTPLKAKGGIEIKFGSRGSGDPAT